MVVIETENGRFEAETMKAAQLAAKKAVKKAAELSAIRSQHESAALVNAEALAFRLLAQWHTYKDRDEKQMPRGNRFCPCGTPSFINGKVISSTYNYSTIDLDTLTGRGTMEVYDRHFIGWIENGCGSAMALVFVADGVTTLYAIGCHEGIIQTTRIPSIEGFGLDSFRVARNVGE